MNCQVFVLRLLEESGHMTKQSRRLVHTSLHFEQRPAELDQYRRQLFTGCRGHLTGLSVFLILSVRLDYL